jgi:2,4-didehydro-3-deoxy-L-rhamnonate hydrolase
MSTPFKLGMFSKSDRRFSGMVFETCVFEIDAVAREFSKPESAGLERLRSLEELLQDWDEQFEALQFLAAEIAHEGMASERIGSCRHALERLRVLPPVMRPPKLLCAAQNYREHVAGMRKTFRDGLEPIEPSKEYQGDKLKSEAYLFLKGSNCISGPFDDIVLPAGVDRVDWEAELAVVIGRPGKNIPASKAMNHVAGYMTANDISCRSRMWRNDRPNIRSDWVGSKSYDTFAPTGPYLVPAAFVSDPMNLRIKCLVNGVTKQDGNSGDMVFDIGDQIEYASKIMSLESGDVFATGTPAGTGQERLEFLKAGDIVETEVEGLGRQRCSVVVGTSEYKAGRPSFT